MIRKIIRLFNSLIINNIKLLTIKLFKMKRFNFKLKNIISPSNLIDIQDKGAIFFGGG